jgi:hypothetical protein
VVAVSDVAIIGGGFLLLAGACWAAGQGYAAVLVLGTGLLLAAVEVVAVKNGGLTITQRFREFRKKHPVCAWALLAMAAAGAVALFVHMARA